MLRRARHYHDHGPRSEKHMPSFLKEVSSEARKEFFKIAHDRKSPRSEVQQRVKAWAEKQGGSVLKDLRNFDAKKKAHFAEIHRNVSLVISQLESAHAKVHKIVLDDSLSKQQMLFFGSLQRLQKKNGEQRKESENIKDTSLRGSASDASSSRDVLGVRSL
ncbi:hypothetical protein OESDEN_03434 [Oesophagostomum dentatum]|uniref:SXP/RAL-2 family protein Ani s 5-like cation-binding domain-containing protein n=1 Tax=Oesophagostomum dentatum TaxID=61180 RepID=A0A0B1TGE4_OESDE|nr:hypothetical protein OESDEN_03434 [Oesophagostomum dentatum]